MLDNLPLTYEEMVETYEERGERLREGLAMDIGGRLGSSRKCPASVKNGSRAVLSRGRRNSSNNNTGRRRKNTTTTTRMMSGSTYGTCFRVTTFGESHGKGVGCVVDGVPPRLPVTEEEIQFELDR